MEEKNKKLQESGEMYLETILILSRKQENVRSIDISEYRGFSKPSVSRAVNILKDYGYITINEQTGYITLNPSGREIAEKIYERHQILTEVLIRMGVDPRIAEDDACRIEHVISDETFESIKKHLESHR
ncbi:MAG: metal-dependent transcriptional regulator [Erysipelotrichaceae bacterium]|nr:metal-dependent transcriptional regulator [Erysipelotrichaceae bacterium]MBQ4253748.1 metal-dependent transcriptional regulator [Erysipelotrichaceae bacterium]